MPTALTMWAASRVPVYLDTPEMELPVPVSQLTLILYKQTVYSNAECYKLK